MMDSKAEDKRIGMLTDGAAKRVFIITNGCPENRIDCARVQFFFETNRWTLVNSYLDADLIVFNACGLTQNAEDWSRRIIATLTKYKPERARLIICGCLPRINPAALATNNDTIIIYGEQDSKRFNDLIEAQVPIEEIYANFIAPHRTLRDTPSAASIYPNFLNLLLNPRSEFHTGLDRIYSSPLLVYDRWLDSRVNLWSGKKPCWFIKIASGCLNACAYCAVKNSRGALKSKTPEKIINEFREGLARGIRNFVLLGTDLGPYGFDIGIYLTTLLNQLIGEGGDFDIRLRNIEPRWLLRLWPKMQPILASGKITFLGIPIESGNDDILIAMRRGYAIGEVKACIHELTERFPRLFIRTQLMTGFPGETSEQFQDTLRLADELVIDYTEVYGFSPRINTAAASLKNQIPLPIIHRRRNQLWQRALLAHTPRRLKKLLTVPV